jgi:hypothetical protein
MLEMIARLTANQIERLLEQKRAAGDERMVVAYGGALHNDLEPRPGREPWSFGPRLRAVTSDRFVELDIIVPELIGSGPAWHSLPWVAHYDAKRHANEVVLFEPSPKSFVLLFTPSHD